LEFAPDFPFVLAPNFPPPFHLSTVENWTLPIEHNRSPRRLSVHQDMGIISPAIQFVESTSPLQMGWRLGLIAGTVHHFVCQYPIQRDVMATLVVWMVSNLAFLIAAFFYTTFGEVLSYLRTFNGFYVGPQATVYSVLIVDFCCNLVKAIVQCLPPPSRHSHRIHNVSNGLGPLENSTDGSSHLKITALHRGLGISSPKTS